MKFKSRVNEVNGRLKIIEDLGIIEVKDKPWIKDHFVKFICLDCGVIFENRYKTFIYKNKKCTVCNKVEKRVWKEIKLNVHDFEVIENLGMRFATEKSKQKKRYVKVKCVKCELVYEGFYALFYNKDKVCVCSSKTRPKTKSDDWIRINKIRRGMIRRCYNEKSHAYKRYGGSDILIFEEWISDINSFYQWSINNGYKDGLSIDRIDNDKGYFPENCRWVDDVTQARNRKKVISIEKVKKIKELLQLKIKHKEIAVIVGTTISKVSQINLGKIFKEIEI